MRTTVLRLPLLTSLACVGMLAAHAQPQWRFHLAFEDGSGARDTLWFIWDTTAHTGWPVDYDLGEGGMAMDPDTFNVWMGNAAGDSTKTLAWPYTWFPVHGGSSDILGSNYQLPLTIRWDRSLFHTDYLPDPDAINTAMFTGSDYFYWFGNHPSGAHSLLEEDSVVVGIEALWSPLFPMLLWVTDQSGLSVNEAEPASLRLSVQGAFVHFQAPSAMEQVQVYDPAGRMVLQAAPMATEARLDHAAWPAGVYIVRAWTTDDTWHHGKFIKMAP